MKRIIALLPLLFIAASVLLLGAKSGPEDLAPAMSEGDVVDGSKAFVPEVARLGDGWEEAFEPEKFGPDELYAKINGGAEVYLEHGFKLLRVFSFLHPDGDYIELFLFDQGDGARFMYEFEQPPEFDADERFEGYFTGASLLMLHDNHYIKVQAAADTPLTRAAVDAIGLMIAETESL